MFQLAELFVSIAVKTDAFKSAMRQVQQDMVKSGKEAGKKTGDEAGEEAKKSMLSKMGVLGGAMSVALGGMIQKGAETGWAKIKETWDDTIGAAKELGRIMRILKVTFGESAKGMEEWATTTSESTGIAKEELLKTADKFGMVALRQGQSRESAAEFGMSMARLAADVKSADIAGGSYESAVQKIYMGSMGAARGLRQMGISFTQHQVQMQAIEMGFQKVNGQFRQTDLQMARVALMSKNLGLAQGDLASRTGTAGLAAAQTTQIWKNLYEDIGKQLLPAVNEWTFGQYRLAQSAKEAFAQAKPYIESFSSAMGLAWAKTKEIVLPIVNSLRSAIADFASKFHMSIDPMAAAFTGFTLAAVAIGPLVVSSLAGIVAAAAPVVAAVGLLYGAFRIAEPYLVRFANSMLGYWPMIRSTVVSSIATIRDWWGNLTVYLYESWEAAQPTLLGVWDTLKVAFWGVVDSIKGSTKILREDFLYAKDVLRTACANIKVGIDSVFGSGATDAILNWGKQFREYVVDKLELVGFTLRNFGSLTEIGFLSAWQTVKNFGTDVQNTFRGLGGYALDIPIVLVEGFQIASSAIGSALEGMYNGFKSWWDWLVEKLRILVEYMVRPIVDAMIATGLLDESNAKLFDNWEENAKKVGENLDISGVFKGMSDEAEKAKKSLEGIQVGLFTKTPYDDVTSERVKQITGDIAKAESDRAKRLQGAMAPVAKPAEVSAVEGMETDVELNRKNDEMLKLEEQFNASEERKFRKGSMYDEMRAAQHQRRMERLHEKEERLSERRKAQHKRRYGDEEKKNAGTRDVAVEEYTTGNVRSIGAVEAMVNARLFATGGGQNIPKEQLAEQKKTNRLLEDQNKSSRSAQPAMV